MIDYTDEGSRSSDVSSHEQVQTSSMVCNAKGRIGSEYLYNLNNGNVSVGPKGSDKVASNDKLDLENIFSMITSFVGEAQIKL